MKHKLVLVTKSIGSPDDQSHDSTWYTKGDEEIVYQDDLWPGVVIQRWHSAFHAGGINEEDCTVLTGPRAFLKCLFWRYYKRQWEKQRDATQQANFEKHWAAQTFVMGERVVLQHRKGGVTERIGGLDHEALNGAKGAIVSKHGKAGYYVRFDDNARVYFTIQAIDLRRQPMGQLP